MTSTRRAATLPNVESGATFVSGEGFPMGIRGARHSHQLNESMLLLKSKCKIQNVKFKSGVWQEQKQLFHFEKNDQK